jgi:two-component system sensor histidine kinase AlgZ
VASINQNPATSALPDFRNVGVVMRILVAVIGLEVAAAFTDAATWQEALAQLALMSALAQPALILSLVLLAALGGAFHRLPYFAGAVAVIVLELAITAGIYRLGEPLLGSASGSIDRALAFTLVASCLLLVYFNLRDRALSPALTEARLQALQARIRPHFLFNSINAVLSLIRTDPKRAEQALEDLAELFRMMLADTRQLSPVRREIELCKQYLGIEQLRLGDRLRVEWRIGDDALEALMPPLVLQPLLENAVYHGIEARIEPGLVEIDVSRSGDRVTAVLRNPYQADSTHHAGNRMALNNIRERLQLHFDAAASLAAKAENGAYEVRITIPYTRSPA